MAVARAVVLLFVLGACGRTSPTNEARQGELAITAGSGSPPPSEALTFVPNQVAAVVSLRVTNPVGGANVSGRLVEWVHATTGPAAATKRFSVTFITSTGQVIFAAYSYVDANSTIEWSTGAPALLTDATVTASGRGGTARLTGLQLAEVSLPGGTAPLLVTGTLTYP